MKRVFTRCRRSALRAAGLARLGRRLLADESGAEILEYVLIAGLIIAAAITAVATVGTKVLARWTTVSDSSL